jgi:hypothetical protein
MIDDSSKLDPHDVDFVLKLIATAKTAGLAELTYRGLHVRFSMLPDKSAQTYTMRAAPVSWDTTLTGSNR